MERDKTYVKVLILYVLARLPEPVGTDALAELCECDGGVTYFDVAQCAKELAETENVTEEGGRYSVTDLGRRDGETMAHILPYSVRIRAERGCLDARNKIERAASVKTSREMLRRGGCIVIMSLNDGGGEVMSLRMYAPNAERAARMEDAFRRRAEEIYGGVLDVFFGN